MTPAPDKRPATICGTAGPSQSPSSRWLWGILLAATALRLVGLGWGLPASDGWDNDGIAPRDFLVGIVETYTPGSYFTYPPLHLILLAALTAPGWVIGLIKAPALVQADVVQELIKVPYMTFFALVARLVSVTMSAGTVYCIARMTRLVAGEPASLIAAAIAALDAILVYYGHTTNLDGPYIFWSVLAMSLFMEGIAHRRPRRLAAGVLCFFCAVTTKDQAYALALISLPAVLICWFICDDWARRHWPHIAKPVASAFVAGAILFSIVSGAAVNPTGFVRRLTFLTGTASADNAYYSLSFDGWLRVFWDGLAGLGNHYPIFFVGLGLYGAVLHFSRFRRNCPAWVAGLLPMLAIFSFTLLFNLVALRTDDRFLLPHSVLLSFYIGIGSAHLLTIGSRLWQGFATVILTVAFAFALFGSLAVDAAFLRDPRYDAEDWLAKNVAPDAAVETYGKNVYLPRFPSTMHVSRVGPEAVVERSPLASASEIRQPYDRIESRRPDVIVISAFWVSRYLVPDSDSGGFGRVYSTVQRELFTDAASRLFFRELLSERRNYCIQHTSKYNLNVFREIHIHQSLNESIILLKRDELHCGPPTN